ncbi:hypothetical protein MUK42_32888 [Musa troglodytarum]|uniref:Uncharacterized protein n=1 Tax=Musa troglodytarum TaxID=320322 RepID=A0A9E7I8M3_9LILI|nr:hypothetical protein MUK42_32888 [Musa troglodytarum]
MSVISALSPSSAFDVRVANGYQRARRLSVMLRLRDRAAPSFLSEQNAPMPMSGIVDCSVRSINNSRYMYPARPIASPQREGRPNHTKKEQDWNIILELAPLKKKIEMSLETSQKRRWETSPGTTAAAVVSLFRQQWPAAMDAASELGCGGRLKGSGIRGVTGLSTSEGKSSMLGDKISGCFRGEKPVAPTGEVVLELRNSLKTGLLGPVALAAGATGTFGAVGFAAAAAAAVSAEPVSIWTTCLKEVVSAWTKVVGHGFASQGFGLGLEVRGGGTGDGDDAGGAAAGGVPSLQL